MGFLAALAMTTPLKAKANNPDKAVKSPDNTALIRAAYTDLTTADHDYDGHREKAAKELYDIAKKDGHTLPEPDKAREASKAKKDMEPQSASDTKLENALSELKKVKDGKHVEIVIKEIQEALAKK